MKSKHALFYCLTVLAFESVLLLLAFIVHTSLFDSRPLAPKGVAVFVLHQIGSIARLTLLRIIVGQIPVNILFHLLALGRARGYGRVLRSSVLVNAGTFLIPCLIVGYLGADWTYAPVQSSAQRAIEWVGTLFALMVAPVIAPILALRFWRGAVLPVPAKPVAETLTVP